MLSPGFEATGALALAASAIFGQLSDFNWDDLPVKEGLHNRHMVGLTAWHTFPDDPPDPCMRKSTGHRLWSGQRRRLQQRQRPSAARVGGNRPGTEITGCLRRLAHC